MNILDKYVGNKKNKYIWIKCRNENFTPLERF